MAVKNTTIFKYNNLPTTCFGLIRPSSGLNTVSEENYLSDLNAGLQGRGHPVAQLVEALRYNSEGRGFDSRCCHWNFSLTYSFRPHYGPGIDSASNRNEYQEYFLGVKAAGE